MVIPPPPHLVFGTDFLFTIIAVVFCFLVYFKTKESYELTKYKGIQYFRSAFLFLGLSYILRFFLSLMMISGIAFESILLRLMFVPFFILPLGYFSTVGIFYLVLSSVWRKVNNLNFLILGHGAAIILSIVSFIMRSHLMLFYLQCVLLVIVVMLSVYVPKGKKRISQTKVLYSLVAVLWLVNLLVIDRNLPFPLGIVLVFQVISLVVFAVIYYKVAKWIK